MKLLKASAYPWSYLINAFRPSFFESDETPWITWLLEKEEIRWDTHLTTGTTSTPATLCGSSPMCQRKGVSRDGPNKFLVSRSYETLRFKDPTFLVSSSSSLTDVPQIRVYWSLEGTRFSNCSFELACLRRQRFSERRFRDTRLVILATFLAVWRSKQLGLNHNHIYLDASLRLELPPVLMLFFSKVFMLLVLKRTSY